MGLEVTGIVASTICEVCQNNLEPDGTCLTCRLAKRVIELEANIVELLFQIKELEELLNISRVELLFKTEELEDRLIDSERHSFEHKQMLVERVEELEANVKGFGV